VKKKYIYIVPKCKEVKTGLPTSKTNLAGSTKEGCGYKKAVLPMTMKKPDLKMAQTCQKMS
jgi:hypothetical protein